MNMNLIEPIKPFLIRIISIVHAISVLMFVLDSLLTFIILFLNGFKNFNVRIIYISSILLIIIFISSLIKKKHGNENDTYGTDNSSRAAARAALPAGEPPGCRSFPCQRGVADKEPGSEGPGGS